VRERVLKLFFTLPLVPSPQGRGDLGYLAACCGVVHSYIGKAINAKNAIIAETCEKNLYNVAILLLIISICQL